MRTTLAKITAAAAICGCALLIGAGTASAHSCRHSHGSLAVGGNAITHGGGDALAVGGDVDAAGAAGAVGGDATGVDFAGAVGGDALAVGPAAAVGGDAESLCEDAFAVGGDAVGY
ncbi:hypothetical protein F4556_005911 [Kitasatospora gansuensis]|uniref:Uncharacterized protein n=1 Tax=Kitasatospora gansuensis TaxID=258050 RepID=A0A7W7SH52_9ACTN|nr:hypothetical protein [Kitasatospora gansuensis]MBB4950376.1 hypothetical protein [Kitasatospora gansuensis]